MCIIGDIITNTYDTDFPAERTLSLILSFSGLTSVSGYHRARDSMAPPVSVCLVHASKDVSSVVVQIRSFCRSELSDGRVRSHVLRSPYNLRRANDLPLIK